MRAIDVLNEGLDKADYKEQNRMFVLYIMLLVLFIFSIVSLCISISMRNTIKEQERQIKDRDYLIITLQVTNDTINHKLLPIGE